MNRGFYKNGAFGNNANAQQPTAPVQPQVQQKKQLKKNVRIFRSQILLMKKMMRMMMPFLKNSVRNGVVMFLMVTHLLLTGKTSVSMYR